MIPKGPQYERLELMITIREERDKLKKRLDDLNGVDYDETRERVRDLSKVLRALQAGVNFRQT